MKTATVESSTLVNNIIISNRSAANADILRIMKIIKPTTAEILSKRRRRKLLRLDSRLQMVTADAIRVPVPNLAAAVLRIISSRSTLDLITMESIRSTKRNK